MKSHQKLHLHFNTTLSLPDRIALVHSAYKELGYINRKSLVAMYGITQLQAGALMRDFIHAHARNIQWDKNNSQYTMKNQEDYLPLIFLTVMIAPKNPRTHSMSMGF
jgi:hypothetical protein